MKAVIKWIAWFMGIWIGILVALELFLTSSALTNIVNKVASDYIDGELSFGKVELSMFKRFPSASISLENFSITYPADRFDQDEQAGVDGRLYHSGCGEEKDTLASFDRFGASIRLSSLIGGKIHISRLELTKPRIYAHQYGSGRQNWDIFKISDTEDTDTTESSLPNLIIGKISLSNNPRIVYTHNGDTLSAMINLKQMNFDGKLDIANPMDSKIDFRMEKLFAAGRTGADTLAFGLDHLSISEDSKVLTLDASAKTMAALRGIGRVTLPIEINGKITLPGRFDDTMVINGINAEIAYVPMSASGQVTVLEEKLAVDVEARINQCKVNEILKGIAENIIPETKNIDTDCIIDMQAKIVGDYVFETGQLPEITASLRVPKSEIGYTGYPGKIGLELAMDASCAADGKVNLERFNAKAETKGADIKVNVSAKDLLCDDPKVNIDSKMNLVLESLAELLPDSLGVKAKGNISAELKGGIKMSQMDLYTFSDADVTGMVEARNIDITAEKDSLKAYISDAQISLGPETKKSPKSGKTFRLLALKGNIDSTTVTYGAMGVKGKSLTMSAMNSTDYDKDTSRVHMFSGKASAGSLILTDNSGMAVGLRGSDNSFRVMPKRSNPKIPVLTFTSRNKGIFLKSDMNRVILSNAELRADATMNSIERKQKAKAFIDSLSRVYPDVPKDSLFFHMVKQRNGARVIPEWMKEEDFRKQDINFRLDETLAKYFREWDLNGNIAIDKGFLATPYFPLRNTLQGFKGHFNNNRVGIDTLGIRCGQSDIAAKGELTGIQRILSGRGSNTLNLDVDVYSSKMDANEMLRAYMSGLQFDPESHDKTLTDASDEEYIAHITADTTAIDKDAFQLLVVPSNLNADIRLNAQNLSYSDLAIEKISANAIMKERCIQITNTSAVSNVGDISFDGFYATRSKKDIKAGFNIQFKDITAEKVISLMPAVDTLMPILKSFSGRLNCEIAATSQLDTNMNIMTPSINGIMRITGDDLYIKDNDMYRTLARKLLFKNKKEGYIEHMSVEGVISDNTVEIFPFIIKMDRYTLALSGIQNLDNSFKYHMSLIRSPFLFKLGMDIYGDDFENWKFKIGKPKYKSAEVPAFSSVIDESKVNLVKSIKDIFRKGVDAAVRENHLEAINEYKRNMKYVRAVDMKLEELSAEEQKQFKEQEAAESEENN